MAYTICNVIDLGPAYTSVTLNAQLYDSANATVGSAITTGFYQRAGANGVYAFVLSIPDAHVGWCDVYVNGASSTILATLPINPAELETKAQLVAALITDTYAELSAVPAATSSIKDKINWLFALARNKITQTSTTTTVRNDADGANVATSAVSDNGSTFTKGKWS